MEIAGGRAVGVVEHGDLNSGRAVFVVHGGLVCRLGYDYADAPARARGLRVVCFDRRAIGCSAGPPYETLTGIAADVAGLADALGLRRFGVLGWSVGGPYALACANPLRERISAIGTMAGAGPLDRPGARAGLAKSDRRMLDLALRHPRRASLRLRGMGLAARAARGAAVKSLAAELSEPDRLVLERTGREFMGGFIEALRQGPAGAIRDYQLWGRPWDFALEEVPLPVHLWQGDDDAMVPVHHARDLAERLPDATLTIVPDAGHLSIAERIGEMLDALAPPA